MPAAERPPRQRGYLWGLLGLAISISFLAAALWDVDLSEVGRQLGRADPVWLVISSVVVTTTFPLRTVRWRLLLAHGGAPPFAPLWHATAIGFMANNVLPARAGEAVRAWTARRLCGVRFTTALASLAVERIFDGIVIVLLLALSLAVMGTAGAVTVGSTNLQVLALSMAALFGGAFLVLLAIARNQEVLLPWFDRALTRALPARAAALVSRLMHGAADGVGVLHSTRDVLRVLIWTFVVWLVNAGSYALAFRAFDVEVPATAALLLQGVVAFGVALPQAPGFFGVFELLVRASLALYAVPGEQAVSFAIGVHLCWFVPITAIGLWHLARAGLTFGEMRRHEAPA